MNLKDLQNDWINEFSKPLIIAGPCSAESEAQMMETAQRLKESGAEVPVLEQEFETKNQNQMVSKE